MTIILDHERNIVLDPNNAPFNNYQAFGVTYAGLHALARMVREFEIKETAQMRAGVQVMRVVMSSLDPIVPNAFNWYSVSLVNYLRLVALVDLMNQNGWKSDALAIPSNRSTIKSHCKAYVEAAVPAVMGWRNKVAAHFAATDPFSDDSLGTLEQSVMNLISFNTPYFRVGEWNWSTGSLPKWGVTETHEQLTSRFWPEVQLKPFQYAAA